MKASPRTLEIGRGRGARSGKKEETTGREGLLLERASYNNTWGLSAKLYGGSDSLKKLYRLSLPASYQSTSREQMNTGNTATPYSHIMDKRLRNIILNLTSFARASLSACSARTLPRRESSSVLSSWTERLAAASSPDRVLYSGLSVTFTCKSLLLLGSLGGWQGYFLAGPGTRIYCDFI